MSIYTWELNTASNYHERCEFELPCSVAISPRSSMRVCHERAALWTRQVVRTIKCFLWIWHSFSGSRDSLPRSQKLNSCPVSLPSPMNPVYSVTHFLLRLDFPGGFPHVLLPKRRMLISFLVCMRSLCIPLDSVAWQNRWVEMSRFPILWNYFRYGIWLIWAIRVAVVLCLRCQFSLSV
jgi:hypothetical protein